VHFRRDYRKNSDLYEQSDIAEIEATFQEYGIKLLPFETFYKEQKKDSKNLDEAFYEWYCDQENQFAKLWEAITEEVFQLLFANRMFLLNFNQTLASCLRDGEISIPNNYQGKHGHIKRAGIPSWVKKAVYLRDHGRCVLCQKDLTGLISTDISLQYDHIVPLNQWGVNDPSNIQLLCDKCNQEKSGKEASTGTKYPAWW
jgi:HNH endonuclease